MTASSLDPLNDELVTIDVSVSGSSVVLTAAGEIDSTTAPVLRQQLDALLDERRPRAHHRPRPGHLPRLGRALRARHAHRRAVRQDVRMRVLASSRAVIRPLQITGLWELLHAEQVAGEPVAQGVA